MLRQQTAALSWYQILHVRIAIPRCDEQHCGKQGQRIDAKPASAHTNVRRRERRVGDEATMSFSQQRVLRSPTGAELNLYVKRAE
ncbi:MAG: hypothetical protein E5V70_09000, partial [Mesorhizobium sp.]